MVKKKGKNMLNIKTYIWVLILGISFSVTAQKKDQKKFLSFDDVFHPRKKIHFDGKLPSIQKWLDDTFYLQYDYRKNGCKSSRSYWEKNRYLSSETDEKITVSITLPFSSPKLFFFTAYYKKI